MQTISQKTSLPFDINFKYLRSESCTQRDDIETLKEAGERLSSNSELMFSVCCFVSSIKSEKKFSKTKVSAILIDETGSIECHVSGKQADEFRSKVKVGDCVIMILRVIDKKHTVVSVGLFDDKQRSKIFHNSERRRLCFQAVS